MHGASQTAPWSTHYPPQVDWHLPIATAPLDHLLRAAASNFGERPAYAFFGRRTTWSRAERQADAVAAGLQRLGLTRGDRVGLMLPNCPAYFTVFFGALRAGLTVVNFNPLYTGLEIARQARDSGITMMATLDLVTLYPKAAALLGERIISHILICGFADMLPPAKAVAFRLGRRRERVRIPRDARHVALSLLLSADASPEQVDVDPMLDIAVLQYTGGTTGTPKGAMLTHANLYANAVQGVRWFHDTTPGRERVLAALPFFHVFALTTVLLFSVRAAAEIIMLPRFLVADAVKVIARSRPTVLPGVPTMFNAIASFREPADLSSIRLCISGGAPLPPEVKRRFEARTGCVLVEGYGLTEASPCVCCNPPAGVNKPGSIGQPLPGTTVDLRDPAAPGVPVAAGDRGELCVRGPQVMRGYWRRPEDTAAAFTPDGMLRTGDIATMDDDGYVFVVDRIKDLILCGGYNVYPRMVEDAIYEHPAVSECTVIGVPDPLRGETVKAFVVPRPGSILTPEALAGFLVSRLSPIEMPKHFEFRDSLPKTMVGKLSRKELVAEERARSRGEPGE